MRLLIVEDEPRIALVIEDVAIDAGFEITGTAGNMSEALELGSAADIAIIDVRLGDGITGPSIARALFSEFGLGVVYFTVNPGLTDDPEGRAVVTKPASPERIVDALSMAAKNARTHRVASGHTFHCALEAPLIGSLRPLPVRGDATYPLRNRMKWLCSKFSTKATVRSATPRCADRNVCHCSTRVDAAQCS
jgi:CheY-like chemotaxis protein